jgi:predicted phage tail component-like protein
MITWNGAVSSGLTKVVFSNPVRQLLGSHRGSFQEIPGKRGSWYYPELRGRRTIKVPGFFLEDAWASGGRRDAFMALADFLDVDIEGRLTFSDDPEYYYEAVLGDCGDITEWRELGTFELEWIVRPFALALNSSLSQFTANPNQQFAWDPDITTPLDPVIEITPTNGTLTWFDLIINGKQIRWYGILNSGQTLTINGISATVTQGVNTDIDLTGAYNAALLDMSNVNGDFPVLVPGMNTLWFIRQLGTSTSFTIKVHYRKAFRR